MYDYTVFREQVSKVIVIAQLTHSPELCFGRPEHKEQAQQLMEFLKNIEQHATDCEVTLHGFYLNSNEHTFYFILEADTYVKISMFLGVNPVLTHHTAKITPVVTLEETLTFAQSAVPD